MYLQVDIEEIEQIFGKEFHKKMKKWVKECGIF